MTKSNDQQVGSTLPAFISEWGVPENLTMDGAQVQVGRNTEFQKCIQRNEINYHVSHPKRPTENPAEGGIREIKRMFYRIQTKRNVPGRLWDTTNFREWFTILQKQRSTGNNYWYHTRYIGIY